MCVQVEEENPDWTAIDSQTGSEQSPKSRASADWVREEARVVSLEQPTTIIRTNHQTYLTCRHINVNEQTGQPGPFRGGRDLPQYTCSQTHHLRGKCVIETDCDAIGFG